jgi:CRP-like cAMP-binding protein
MVSPELLRRYPFFGTLEDAQLKAVAMVCTRQEFEKSQTFFEEHTAAITLYLLIEGSIDLLYRSDIEFPGKNTPPPKEFLVDDINQGEVFGIASLIEPYSYSATARASRRCEVVAIDAEELRKLFNNDVHLGLKLMTQITKTAVERIHHLRVQLATAWS